MSTDVIDGFLLAEIVAGPARGGLTASFRELADARDTGDRARFAARTAQRLRPSAPPLEALPPRVRALLGGAGPAPRRRYRPPPGLALAVRRALADSEVSDARGDGGRGSRELAELEEAGCLG